MVDQGLATELMNATEVAISDGTDNYIQLQELDFDLSHPETIEETVDAVHYFYGKRQAFVEGTILGSDPELSTFVTKCAVDANGGAITNNWVLSYKALDATVATATITATMAPNLRVTKAIGGAVKYRFRLRVFEATTAIAIG